MKYLSLVFLILLSGCSFFDDPPGTITVTSTIPVDIYNAAGGTGLELTQSNPVGALLSVQAAVEGTSFVLYLDNCKYSYDVAKKTPDYLFWLSQPFTINYDPTIAVCGNVANCVVDPLSVSMVGTVATATFSCP